MTTQNNNGKVLTKAELLSGKSLKMTKFAIEQLGGSIYLRELSARQLLAYNNRVQELQATDGASEGINAQRGVELMALLVSMSACNQNGELMMTEEEASKLADNSMTLITELGTEVLKLSGIDSKAVQSIKDDLVKKGDSASS